MTSLACIRETKFKLEANNISCLQIGCRAEIIPISSQFDAVNIWRVENIDGELFPLISAKINRLKIVSDEEGSKIWKDSLQMTVLLQSNC
jgi:hypothetical protein